MKTINSLVIALLLMTAAMVSSCDESGDPQADIELSESQTASVSMRGKWGQASDPLLPFGTTETVLDDFVMAFTITDDYNPMGFTASGADYFFGATEEAGLWNWEDQEFKNIKLTNISPISNIQVLKEASEIRVSFIYNGEDGGRAFGVGEYAVTLKKIAP